MTVRCPYCFRELDPRQAPLRCSSPPERCGWEVDRIYSHNWGVPGTDVSRPPILANPSAGSECRTCGRPAEIRLCPHCHHDLTPVMLDPTVERRVISIVGGRFSGKSHYLAALVRELDTRGYPDFEILLSREDDHTRNHFTRAYEQRVFRERRVIDLTQVGARRPFVFSLRMPRRTTLGGSRTRLVFLVFHDIAGELLKDEDEVRAFAQSVVHADALIYLVDPLQLPPVREALRERGRARLPDEIPPGPVLDLVERLVRRGSVATRLPIPIATLVTKQDALRDLLGDGTLGQDADYSGGFDVAEARQRSEDLADWLATMDPKILGDVQQRFTPSAFFLVSSLGCEPNRHGQLPFVSPFRVIDPLLWILSRFGYLEGGR